MTGFFPDQNSTIGTRKPRLSSPPSRGLLAQSLGQVLRDTFDRGAESPPPRMNVVDGM
jgi:hypothetical protein